MRGSKILGPKILDQKFSTKNSDFTIRVLRKFVRERASRNMLRGNYT